MVEIPKPQFEFVLRDTEGSECLGLVDFKDVAFSEKTAIVVSLYVSMS